MPKNDDLSDFSKAKYTAVISDLHLCEAEPVNEKFPLWKKYKTEQFFFDDIFSDFLNHLVEKAGGEQVELVLNGDIFDFDSVMMLPEDPPYELSLVERIRGLHPQEEKACFKIKVILDAHKAWLDALRSFVQKGHRVIFVIGNHDLQLHFERVQEIILEELQLSGRETSLVRFCEWFYISNKDTLIEHGNQYDPYCVCQDPINPFVKKFNRVELREPFGNLTIRFLINGMGYFNPHVNDNFIMSAGAYIRFFFRYMLRSQPLLVWSWFWSALFVLFETISNRMLPSIRDPLMVEEKSERIARKANTTPGVVRQLRTLAVSPAASHPWLLAKELWLDRALSLLFAGYLIVNLYLFLNQIFDISIWWVALPLAMFLPPFLFYAGTVGSSVGAFSEPQERVLMNSSWIAKVMRVVYGHTHIVRHEIIGGVEHLNSGCWSPAFTDVECTKSVGQKTFVWIFPGKKGQPRESELLRFVSKKSEALFRRRGVS